MLRLSKMADYGTRVMVYMAADQRMHSANEVAQSLGISVPTVSKILKMLARENLVVSVRGAKGGYVLSRKIDAINMAEIIDAMDGPISITECSGNDVCSQEASCSMRSNWQGINKIIQEALQSVTLSDMAVPKAQVVDTSALRI